MKLRAIFSPLAVFATALIAAAPAHAQVVDPCTVFTCMAGISGSGLSGGVGCTPATAIFFAIQVWDPEFDPSATSLARRTYLTEGCPKGAVGLNEGVLEEIMTEWGEVP